MKTRKQILKRLITIGLAITSLGLGAVALRAETAVVDAYDERPVPVKAVPPVYPPEMLREGQSGLVTVAVVIDEKGYVVSREVEKSTRREFDEAALDAVRKWRFKPARKAGLAVKVRILLPIEFSCQS